MLLDTSGLLCYLDRRDHRHAEAVSTFQTAGTRLTHNYVLAELVALCQIRGYDRTGSLDFLSELMDNPTVETVWVDEALHRAAVLFLKSRHDKSYSLCDAVSFLLMRHYGIAEAHTTDGHFDQEGFVRLLKTS